MSDDQTRTDPKPPGVKIDVDLIPGLLLRAFIDEGDEDLARAAGDGRLSWIAEGFDELGYRTVHVWFGDEEIAMARFHWSLLTV